jgi:hypothetical protein
MMAKFLIAVFVFVCIAATHGAGFALESSMRGHPSVPSLRLEAPALLHEVTRDYAPWGFGLASRLGASIEADAPGIGGDSDETARSMEAGPKYSLGVRLALGGLTTGVALVFRTRESHISRGLNAGQSSPLELIG